MQEEDLFTAEENLPLLVLGGNEGVKSPQNSITWKLLLHQILRKNLLSVLQIRKLQR